MPDSLEAAVDALASVEPTVTWGDVEARIDRPDATPRPMPGDDGPSRTARPIWFVAAAVLIVLAVTVGLLVESRVGVEQRPVTTSPPPTIDPNLEPTDASPYQVAHAKEWLAEFDPAEIAYLQAQANGGASDALLESTLEFRRACRELSRARAVAESSTTAARASAVAAIADPELARIDDRTNTGPGSMAAQWHVLFTDASSGRFAPVDDFLGRDCADSVAWHP